MITITLVIEELSAEKVGIRIAPGPCNPTDSEERYAHWVIQQMDRLLGAAADKPKGEQKP